MMFFFKLILPMVMRYAMNRGAKEAASFLQNRHLRRTETVVEPEAVEVFVSPVVVPDEPVEIVCPAPTSKSFLAGDFFWYTLSGTLLGIAFSLIATYILREESDT